MPWNLYLHLFFFFPLLRYWTRWKEHSFTSLPSHTLCRATSGNPFLWRLHGQQAVRWFTILSPSSLLLNLSWCEIRQVVINNLILPILPNRIVGSYIITGALALVMWIPLWSQRCQLGLLFPKCGNFFDSFRLLSLFELAKWEPVSSLGIFTGVLLSLTQDFRAGRCFIRRFLPNNNFLLFFYWTC